MNRISELLGEDFLTDHLRECESPQHFDNLFRVVWCSGPNPPPGCRNPNHYIDFGEYELRELLEELKASGDVTEVGGDRWAPT